MKRQKMQKIDPREVTFLNLADLSSILGGRSSGSNDQCCGTQTKKTITGAGTYEYIHDWDDEGCC
jgi:hypothetical protein